MKPEYVGIDYSSEGSRTVYGGGDRARRLARWVELAGLGEIRLPELSGSAAVAVGSACTRGAVPSPGELIRLALKRFAAKFAPYGYEIGAGSANSFLLTFVAAPTDQLELSEDGGCPVIEDIDGHRWHGSFSTPPKEVLEVLEMHRDAEDI